MSSWGKNSAGEGSSETKPRYLTDAEKRDVYATEKGWTAPAGGNDGISEAVPATGTSVPDREVIVAIGDLSGATKLAAGTISSVYWSVASFSKADGGKLSAVVNYNEQVDVTGTPRVRLTNSRVGNNFNLTYASGTGTNRLTFDLTLPADDATTNATDVLTIGVNAVNHNGGSTIKDAGTATDATITHSAVSDTLEVAA